MVIEQYPDTITYQDENGTDVKIKCRFRLSNGTNLHKKKDDSDIIFKFDIAFPLGTKPILAGTIIDGQDRSCYFFCIKRSY